jgi:integrative and conjugative element protein (TIGR02256 family)
MKVEFPAALRRQMHGHLARAGGREIGGLLMAEQIEPGHFRLAQFSVDERSGGAAFFERSMEDHGDALQQFYDRTGSDFARFNYLGEWHSHPNHMPEPSTTDVASMIDLVEAEQDIPFAMLLIVRKAWWKRILSSATLFRRGAPAARVEIVECE